MVSMGNIVYSILLFVSIFEQCAESENYICLFVPDIAIYPVESVRWPKWRTIFDHLFTFHASMNIDKYELST